MTADSGEALRSLLVSMNEWLGNDKGLMNEDVVEWRDQLAAALLAEGSAQEPPFDIVERLHSILTVHGISSRSTYLGLTTDLIRWAADACRQSQPPKAEARDSRPAPPLDWQPIETAPKDGTRVLFRGVSKAMSFSHAAIVDGWVDSKGEAVHCYSYKLRLTHWMPLHDPPAALPTKET